MKKNKLLSDDTSVRATQSGVSDILSPMDRNDVNRDTITHQEMLESDIIESVNAADGSYEDILGGEIKTQPVVQQKVPFDEFEAGRNLTRDTPDDDIIVKMRDVRISFKMGSLERVIINHLNLDIRRGEILGLVGESGSGKTTIGRAIIRINKVSGGEILYNNVRISGKIPSQRERLLKTKIQMIFQDPGDSLNDRANIDYIVSEGLRAFHLYVDEQDRIRKVTEMMQKVGLRPEYLSRYPHEFSGGQRQRIGIARCMIMNPEFVVADEPISALDVSIRAQVLNLIKDFQKESNLTVLFIAHDLSVVKYISDRIAVIYAGHIVELAPAVRLFEAPLHPYTKSLLSAVPIPDPKIERRKKIIVYNPMLHHYVKSDAPDLKEVEPGHFVRCNTPEFEAYLEEIKKIGGKN